MKKLLYIVLFLSVLSFVSCSSRRYEVIINDNANSLSEKNKEEIANKEIVKGYQLIVETVEFVDPGNLASYSRKKLKEYTKQYDADKYILVSNINNPRRMIVTEMPVGMQRLVYIKYGSEYYNLQNKDLSTMIDFINEKIDEYEDQPWWERIAINEYFDAALEWLVSYLLPSDSYIYKIFMWLPFHCSLFLFSITHSIFWSLFIIVILSMIISYLTLKCSQMSSRWSILLNILLPIFFKILTLIFLLITASFYIIILPRAEHLYLFQRYGYSTAQTAALDIFYGNMNMDAVSLWIPIVFCIVVFINYMLTDNFMLSMTKPEYQKAYYDYSFNYDNHANDKISQSLYVFAQGMQDSDDRELKDMPEPYSRKYSKDVGNAIVKLFLMAIPFCFFMNSYFMIIMIAIFIVEIMNKLPGLIISFNFLAKANAFTFVKYSNPYLDAKRKYEKMYKTIRRNGVK